MPTETSPPKRGRKPKQAAPVEPVQTTEQIVRIPLIELHPFPDHPYGIREDQAMQDTVDSVKQNGVVVPAIVRPRAEGGYEIVAGHRRKLASEQAGFTDMPCIVRNLTDDEAIIQLVDSNAQREDVLPSERAKAYKMRLEAIKRTAGRPRKALSENAPNNSANFRSDDEVGNVDGMEANAVPPAPDKQEQEADDPRLKEIEHYAVEESAILLDTYPMPDDSVSMSDLEGAGYLDGDMLPITRDRAYEMMDQGLTVYGIVDGGAAEMCLDSSDIDALPVDALFSVPQEEWEESKPFDDKIQERLEHQEEREAAFLDCPGDAYAIYQVKHTDDLRFIRYESLEDLQGMGQQPQRGNYDLVYTRAGLPEGQSHEAILGNLWHDFNMDRPADYHSPSMSVSDIIAIKQGGEVSYHYCDSVGFQKLPGFNQPENYLKAAEMAMEDDYGMIDGIINNGPKQPTVAELEAQVKAGQTISLMDLAAAVQAERKAAPKAKEERPSIMDRLKQPLPKQTKKTAPQRSAEKELI